MGCPICPHNVIFYLHESGCKRQNPIFSNFHYSSSKEILRKCQWDPGENRRGVPTVLPGVALTFIGEWFINMGYTSVMRINR
jgi:hypothetical protein